MKKIVLSAVTCLVAATAWPVFAQTSNPNVSTPSAQNSGAGISGYSGGKSGPSAKGGTVGSGATNQQDPAVRQQDPAKIQGLPGNKSGPPARPQPR
jgi:hypothetical protein